MSNNSRVNKIDDTSVLLQESQESVKKKVDIQIDEYEGNENTKELANLSINNQVKAKTPSNFLQVASKKRLTTSLNTSTSSSLSSSSSSSSSANNLNTHQQLMQHQYQLESPPSDITQNSLNSNNLLESYR